MCRKTKFRLLLVFIASSLFTTNAFAEDFMLLLGDSNSTKELSKQEAKRILTGKTGRWTSSNNPVHICLGPEKTPEMVWLVDFLGIPWGVYRQFLMERVFQGNIPKPIESDSMESCHDMVRKVGGGITVIKKSEIKEGQKTISVSSMYQSMTRLAKK